MTVRSALSKTHRTPFPTGIQGIVPWFSKRDVSWLFRRGTAQTWVSAVPVLHVLIHRGPTVRETIAISIESCTVSGDLLETFFNPGERKWVRRSSLGSGGWCVILGGVADLVACPGRWKEGLARRTVTCKLIHFGGRGEKGQDHPRHADWLVRKLWKPCFKL